MHTYIDRPQMRVVSLGFTALPATVATVVLFLLMHSLIATDMNPPEILEPTRLDVIWEVPEITEIPKTERPDRPQDVAREPERLEPEIAQVNDDFEGGWRGTSLPPVTEKGPITLGTNMVVPYMRLQPEYPTRAIQRGIEGYVDLAFDITAAGATSNIRVIEAQPQGVFERAAIRALEKWKYKVPVTDGRPQGQVDMMTRLTFELEK